VVERMSIFSNASAGRCQECCSNFFKKRLSFVYCILLVVIIKQCYCIERIGFNATLQSTIINKDPFFDTADPDNLGKMISINDDNNEILIFEEYLNKTERHGYSDGEAIDSIKNFFWGKRNGIVLEIGALDGLYLSQSKPMVDKLGWHRIIIEGAPTWLERLKQYSKDALSLHLTVCNHPHFIHYIDKKDEGINGILEYMSPSFIRDFHKDAYNTTRTEWHTLPSVTKVPCFPLSSVFTEFKIYYINYFILDVEGAEYDVLQSINFDLVMFDVITVETEKQYRNPAFTIKLTTFLRSKGYHRLWCSGRNSWYVHYSYNISTHPNSDFQLNNCVRDP